MNGSSTHMLFVAVVFSSIAIEFSKKPKYNRVNQNRNQNKMAWHCDKESSKVLDYRDKNGIPRSNVGRNGCFAEDCSLISHIIVNAFSYIVADENLSELNDALGKDLSTGNMPAIRENPTKLFPMFITIDLAVPEEDGETIKTAIMSMARIVNEKIQLFYLQKNFYCIVCTKGIVKQSDGLWKCGIRMHWPDLIVESTQALHIRESMVAGLDLKDWSPLLGVKRPKWNTIVRSEVYSFSQQKKPNGIRMIGAPNAKKCNICKNLNNCSMCGLENGRYIMDKNVYALKCVGFLDQSGKFEIDKKKTTEYGSDAAALVKDTSIRRDQDGLEVTKTIACLNLVQRSH